MLLRSLSRGSLGEEKRRLGRTIYDGRRRVSNNHPRTALFVPSTFSKPRTANLTATGGTVLYDEAKKVAKWHIPKIDSKKTVQLTGTMAVKGHRPEESPPIQLEWKIPMASISGLAVSGLSVVNEAYKPYKGVRTITKSGKFTVRCG